MSDRMSLRNKAALVTGTCCPMTANWMVRPCSCSASKRSWQGTPKTRSTPCLRHPILRSPARTRSTSWAAMRAAPSCCGKSGHVAKWERGSPIYPPCLIGMEACVGAHHLSPKLASLGHDARLIPAKYVCPYSKAQKNDFNDAEAIAEAVQRPTMKFVATKTAEELDLQALHRVRERLVSQRTGIIKQIRAFMLERGIAVR